MLYCSLLYIDKLIMQFHIQFRIDCLSVFLMLPNVTYNVIFCIYADNCSYRMFILVPVIDLVNPPVNPLRSQNNASI